LECDLLTPGEVCLAGGFFQSLAVRALQKEPMSLLHEIRHEQMLTAEHTVIRNLERQGLSKPASTLDVAAKATNPSLELCELAKPYLQDGARLFVSKSIVVAINDSQPVADRLADIQLTIRLLTVSHARINQEGQ
jgi:hypothetical protein